LCQYIRPIIYYMNRTTKPLLAALLCVATTTATAQYWQQRAEYKIDVELNHENHQYTGKQTITYFNNSPDILQKVFFHLYFNAFQPGSAMDVRSRTIKDPDSRVADRIANLKPEEYGWLHIKSLKMDGKSIAFFENETILEIELDKPIGAGAKATFELEYEGQVPQQVRRSGRDNAEGIDYSMTQWYPKMCEYDEHGWHANPYIGREFYGVWGDFEVNINIDESYTIGATGVLQNADEIGKGYTDTKPKNEKKKGEKQCWKFKAQNVHDFAWAADPDFVHDQVQIPGGPVLHFIYQGSQEYSNTWKEMQPLMVKAFDFMSKNFGVYPYPQYTFIQGGDGGMEYPMITLITGNRKLPSLTGVSVHEAAHSWYQGVLGTNESLYAWMDEGFTSFATQETMDYLFKQGMPSTHKSAYGSYFSIVQEKEEEALDTHADHFITNHAYGTAAYSKGEVYLTQLEYVVGTYAFRIGLLNYFRDWKFKHPDCYDFIRVMEKQSGMELDWYNEYFVNTTKTIDYGISMVESKEGKTSVTLQRIGDMPMPLDVEVKYTDGSYETFYIATDIMRDEKPADGYNGKWSVQKDWNWVEPTYTLEIPKSAKQIESIEIDPSKLMADVERVNNLLVIDSAIEFLWKK
ncbi:MAG: M1 family metallopeptidase, partial [Flavobacteriales bacterium]